MSNDKLIARIQKLLALTGSDYTEEAQSALAKAQTLMAEHDLSMTEIEAKDAGDQDVLDGQIDVGKKKTSDWEKMLVATVADGFRCNTFFRMANGGSTIHIYGMPSDVEVAQQACEFALEAAEKAWKQYQRGLKQQRERLHQDTSRRTMNAFKNTFMQGFRVGVRDTLKENAAQNALVLVKDPKLNEFKTRKVGNRRYQSNARTRKDADTVQQGYTSGQNTFRKRQIAQRRGA